MINFLQRLFSRKNNAKNNAQSTNKSANINTSYDNYKTIVARQEGVAISYNNSKVDNSVVYQCIKTIQREFIKQNVNLDTEDIWLKEILKKPNLHQSQPEFFEDAISSLLIHGNAYIKMERNIHEKLHSMRVLNPKLMKIEIGNKSDSIINSSLKKQYIYSGKILKNEDVMHIKNSSIESEVYGTSSLEMAMPSINMLKKIDLCNASVLENMTHPFIVFKTKDGYVIDDEQRAHLLDQFAKNYRGLTNSGQVMFLQGPCEISTINTENQSLLYLKEQEIEVEKICNAFGVPLIFVSSLSKHYMSYFCYERALKFLYDTTIKTYSVKLEHAFNNWFISQRIPCQIKFTRSDI